MLDYKETYTGKDKKPYDNKMEYLTMEEAENKFGSKGKLIASFNRNVK